jgi:hypothetical protein
MQIAIAGSAPVLRAGAGSVNISGRLARPELVAAPELDGMYLRFQYHSLRRDLSNFALVRHRDYTGFLVSMHQSGTHWLKHMLATAIALRYGLPPPARADANDLIGGIRDTPRRPGVPVIASSHSVPHRLLRAAWFRRCVRLPPYVVLVRDLRAALVANYEKWKGRYGCAFPEYLRGDMGGHRFNSDLWSCIRFWNAWGAIADRFPGQTLVVRYEDLERDALAELGRVNDFLKLDLAEDALRSGVAESTKEKMARKTDPGLPPGVNVVRDDARSFAAWYAAADRAFLETACGRLLRPGVFGYDLRSWPASSA